MENIRDDLGQSVVEYALILGIVLLLVVVSIKSVGDGVNSIGRYVADVLGGEEYDTDEEDSDIEDVPKEDIEESELELVRDFEVKYDDGKIGLYYVGGMKEEITIPTHVYVREGKVYAPLGRCAPDEGGLLEYAGGYGEDRFEISWDEIKPVESLYRTFFNADLAGSVSINMGAGNSVETLKGFVSWNSNLEELDITGMDTSKVREFDHAFSGCVNLKDLNLEGIDTGNVEMMNYVFSRCGSLETLDLTGMDTGSVRSFAGMFSECSGLRRVDGIDMLDTSAATEMSYMFSECSKLESLDLRSFDTRNVVDMKFMFYGCSELDTFLVNDNFLVGVMGASGTGSTDGITGISNDSSWEVINRINELVYDLKWL